MNGARLLRIGRAARLALHLVYALGLVVAVLIPLWLLAKPWWRPIRNRVVMYWFRGLARQLGLRIVAEGAPTDARVLRVANHVSWLDIVVLNAISPSIFVAKAEVAQWPLIGWMAEWLGTLFLRRGDVRSSQRLIEIMSWQLRRGEAVTLFPEGTTGNGQPVGKFYGRLYQPALSARAPVQPVAISYPCSETGAAIHPLAPFVGDQTLLSHVWALLGARSMVARVVFLPPLPTADANRPSLAIQSRAAIEAVLMPAREQARMAG